MGIPPHTGRAIELSAADAYQYERLATSLLDEALFEYDHFVSVDRRRVNAAQWRHWRQDDDITVYRERTNSSDSNDDGSNDVEPSLRAVASPHKSATPRILAVGSLANTLDDVLYGVVTPSAATMRLRAAYTTTDDYVDGAVLAPIRTPTPHDPFQFIGLKWLLQRGNGLGLVRPQDFVFLEATGVQVRQDGSGQRVGFHIMHSVELPASVSPLLVPTNTRIQRGAFSTCYLYHELANGAVDVYMTAVVQPRGHVLASMAGRAAAAMLVNNWRALTLFAENKKLAWLLETHRQLQETTPTDPAVAHHNVSRCALCAKSFKGFTNRTKKKTSCQLCSLTVCGHCTVTRTLRHEGVARGSVVSTEMQFCKKCVATAGEESASEIARQQLWESEIVRTGRQHTQTALAIARRETVRARPTAYTYNPVTGLSRERDVAEDAFLAMQDTQGGQQKPAKMSVSSDRRRTLNGTWNSSARATDSLSIGTLNCRTSWFQDPASQPSQNAPADADAAGDAGRESTTSSALVVMDDRANVTRRMKALDYLPSSRPSQQGADDTASAIIARSSMASSSVFTESQDFEVESVYSASSSIAVLDLAASSRGLESSAARRAQQPLTIAEEDHEPVSELEAFYLEQQRQQQVQQQQLLQRQRQQIQQQQRQSHLIQQQYQQPQPPQRRQPHARRSTMILLDPTQQQNQPRASRVRFSSAQDPASGVRDSELLPGRPSLSPSVAPSVMTSSASVDEQRLSYQMQLWMQMHELRDTAESAFQITQRNSEAIAEQHPELLNNMRELVAQKAQARRQQRKQMMTMATPSKPSLSSMGGSSFTFSSQQPTPVKLSHRASTPVRY